MLWGRQAAGGRHLPQDQLPYFFCFCRNSLQLLSGHRGPDPEVRIITGHQVLQESYVTLETESKMPRLGGSQLIAGTSQTAHGGLSTSHCRRKREALTFRSWIFHPAVSRGTKQPRGGCSPAAPHVWADSEPAQGSGSPPSSTTLHRQWEVT